MIDYPVRADEAERLETLLDLKVLDTKAHAAIDRLVEATQLHFSAAIAAVTMLDAERQWFFNVRGAELNCMDRDVAFCNHTILGDTVIEAADAAADPRYHANPLVTGEPHIRYYIGAPVIVSGAPLGALCVVDFAPRPPAPEASRAFLSVMASAVSHEIVSSGRMRRATDQLAVCLAEGRF